MKVKAEDILKPGDVLFVEEIDTNSQFYNDLMKVNKKAWAAYERYKRRPFKNLVITI
ncbi:MAG TPA: hypothetical protein VK589_06080 [Chryseolinea sp.]|nr:hypothetical protein [Chryseolinea sp.]